MSTTSEGNGAKETVAYSYDNNGNMVYNGKKSIKAADGGQEGKYTVSISGQGEGEGASFYGYDELNRLTSTTSGSKITKYRYNGDGLRVEKDANGSVTRYLYEEDKVVLETDADGNETASFMYNGHADVTELIDGTGEIIGSYYYDAFGNITEQSGDADNPFKYANYLYDDESGLYYLNARYYDPKIARFITEDSYTGNIKDPLSLNLYTYCHNEPVMYDDPTGHYDASKESGKKEKEKELLDKYNKANVKSKSVLE